MLEDSPVHPNGVCPRVAFVLKDSLESAWYLLLMVQTCMSDNFVNILNILI